MYKTSVPWRSYAHLYIIHSNRIIHNSICAFRYKLGIGHDKTAIALWPEMSKTTRWNVWSRLHAQWFYFMYHVHILFITSLFVKFNAAEQQEQKKNKKNCIHVYHTLHHVYITKYWALHTSSGWNFCGESGAQNSRSTSWSFLDESAG